MSAILFGSISTIADTSELQRQSFNESFTARGLSWDWNRDDYRAMLGQNGGQQRIADYARSIGEAVDAAAVHRSKSEIFRKHLTNRGLTPRPGVAELIRDAKKNGMKVALVTTTSPDNIAALSEALRSELDLTAFDIIVDSSSVERPKPDKAAYVFALRGLSEVADDCLAIEDNEGGVQSAVAAGLTCVAFPNENTAGRTFDDAVEVVDQLTFEDLRRILAGAGELTS